MEIEDKYQALLQRTQGDYQAFLYDCDGTLARNMHLHKAAYIDAAAQYGIDLDPELIDETAGWPTVKVAAEINQRYGSELEPSRFAKEKSGIYMQKYILQTQPVEFVVRHLIAHAGKLPVAIVTGGSRRTVSKTLNVLGISKHIDLMVCSGETERGKPYPDPFLKAAELLQVAPQKCLVFEDGAPGVQAAIAAGMDWIRVDQI